MWCRIKNRVLMAPMTIQAGYFDGSVTSEMIDYYQFRLVMLQQSLLKVVLLKTMGDFRGYRY